MLMRYWQPFTEIETIRQQLDKAFDGLAAARDTAFFAVMRYSNNNERTNFLNVEGSLN